MAGYTDNERLKLVFKVQAANVIDAASNFNWYEAKFAFNPDRKSTRLNSSHVSESRMPSSA